MKTKFIFLLLCAIGFSALTTSCKKNKTGDLKVSVIDGLGNALGANHTVYLYRGKANFDAQTYEETAITDNAGQVQFLELVPGDYYADCDWENQLGFTITSEGGGSVEAKMVTTITIAP